MCDKIAGFFHVCDYLLRMGFPAFSLDRHNGHIFNVSQVLWHFFAGSGRIHVRPICGDETHLCARHRLSKTTCNHGPVYSFGKLILILYLFFQMLMPCYLPVSPFAFKIFQVLVSRHFWRYIPMNYSIRYELPNNFFYVAFRVNRFF